MQPSNYYYLFRGKGTAIPAAEYADAALPGRRLRIWRMLGQWHHRHRAFMRRFGIFANLPDVHHGKVDICVQWLDRMRAAVVVDNHRKIEPGLWAQALPCRGLLSLRQ